MYHTELISVILPCYNGALTLEKCLKSVNSQNMSLELIFINDGSTDTTLSIINNFKFNAKINLKLISRENKGFLFSLDEGINKSTGEFIARIDADDIWADNHIVLLKNEFQKNQDLVLVGSAAFVIDDNDNIIGTYKVAQKHEDIIKHLHMDSPFIHSSVLFKKSDYQKTVGYLIGKDMKSMHIADYNLWFEFSKIGICENIHEKTIYYRKSNNSMSRTVNKQINYSARLTVMRRVNNYYKRYLLFSLLQQLKVQIRIAQFYLINTFLQ